MHNSFIFGVVFMFYFLQFVAEGLLISLLTAVVFFAVSRRPRESISVGVCMFAAGMCARGVGEVLERTVFDSRSPWLALITSLSGMVSAWLFWGLCMRLLVRHGWRG